ncbi:MAG: hypothetical protein KTR14_05200 [Vampirovibrio sp.]|nr:hypothetical protein [Vampirovibrio sp.]
MNPWSSQQVLAASLMVSVAWHTSGIAFVQAADGINNASVAENLPAVVELALPTDDTKLELAHADDGNVEFTSSIVAGHVDQVSQQHGSVEHSVLSDSLWVNLALTMAYERDPEIRRYLKKSGRLGKVGTVSAIGLSGLGMASSVLSLATLDAGGEAHAEGEEHSIERDSPTASVLGVVGSAVSLAVLGGQMYFRHRYNKKIAARQVEIKTQVEYGVDHIDSEKGQAALAELIGERATLELTTMIAKPAAMIRQ